MLNFCTLFNTTYLSRGLAMYKSLEEQCADFHLYVIAFDQHCFEVLQKLNLKHATIVNLKQFEDERLLAVKKDRTSQEYCWTCGSVSIKYCIETFGLDHCTYVDADLLFFSDPKVLIDEMGQKSVLITEHRYTPCYDQSKTSGIYCVQFMTFKNNPEGMEVLNWWVDACFEWCYNRFEDNKFGDQKYLDDWTIRFPQVHVLNHLGGGVAPWNVQQYTFKNKAGKITGRERTTHRDFDLVFYHYHGFSYSLNNSYLLTEQTYRLKREHIRALYRPYVYALSEAGDFVTALNEGTTPHEITNKVEHVNKRIGRAIKFFIRGYYKNFCTKRSLEYGFFS